MEVDASPDFSATSQTRSEQIKMDSSASGSSSSAFTGWYQPGDDSSSSQGQIDERNVIERPFNLSERFVTVLDQLDTRVERLRKEAMTLQEKRDFLFMSIDLIKSNDLMSGMNEYEREEIHCYIHRVNSRLSTVELNVRTVRDQAQEDSLHQVNVLIDSLITNSDPITARQRCQSFLNACSVSDPSYHNLQGFSDQAEGNFDKKFECALLGCTLDDQKNIKKRLLALITYLNKQSISD